MRCRLCEHHDWRGRALAILALLLVALVQPILLPLNELGSQHYWAQGVIGWCLLPLVLDLSVPTGTAVLLLAWLLGSAVELLRAPSAAHWVNIGLGTASILGVQLFALAFNVLMRDAAADAHAEFVRHINAFWGASASGKLCVRSTRTGSPR